MANRLKPSKPHKLPPFPTQLLPGNEEALQFFTFFSHLWDFIYADMPPYGDKPSWLTQTAYPLDARNAWGAYHDQDVLVGVRFGVSTWYFLFDIDQWSSYHPVQSLASYKRLIQTMEDAGFTRYMVISSSESEGLHVYFFLPEAVSTDALASAIDQLLKEKGFDIGDGTLEVFPNVKGDADSLYKAHRLPLQRGSYVLDPVTFEEKHQDISAFLREAALDAEGQDGEAIAALLSRRVKTKRSTMHKRLFSTEGGSYRADLLERMREGWTHYGQTNQLLWVIGTYGRIFLRLEGEALTSYIVHAAKASPGYRDYCRHQHEIEKRARDWMRFSMKHYYPYGSGWVERDTTNFRRDWRYTELGIGVLPERRTPQEETHEDTLRRVRYVVEELRCKGELPRTVTGRVAAIRMKLRELFGRGTSMDTLYKEEYRALWHPSCDEKYPMLLDPWDEPCDLSGGISLNAEVEVHSTTSPNKVIYALPPGGEVQEAGAEEEFDEGNSEKSILKPAPNSSRPQAKTHHTTSSILRTHNPCLSGYSGATDRPTDKQPLSVGDTRRPVLPGSSCCVVGYVRGLPRGSRVLVDALSPDGLTVTVLDRLGVALSGIPPDVLEPEDYP